MTFSYKTYRTVTHFGEDITAHLNTLSIVVDKHTIAAARIEEALSYAAILDYKWTDVSRWKLLKARGARTNKRVISPASTKGIRRRSISSMYSSM